MDRIAVVAVGGVAAAGVVPADTEAAAEQAGVGWQHAVVVGEGRCGMGSAVAAAAAAVGVLVVGVEARMIDILHLSHHIPLDLQQPSLRPHPKLHLSEQNGSPALGAEAVE